MQRAGVMVEAPTDPAPRWLISRCPHVFATTF